MLLRMTAMAQYVSPPHMSPAPTLLSTNAPSSNQSTDFCDTKGHRWAEKAF